jgi:uncharacterized protein YbjT (DUF2867 family)
LAATGNYKIRAVTRDPSSDKAKALASEFKGVELVKGDLNDEKFPASVFEGAYGVFLVSFQKLQISLCFIHCLIILIQFF